MKKSFSYCGNNRQGTGFWGFLRLACSGSLNRLVKIFTTQLCIFARNKVPKMEMLASEIVFPGYQEFSRALA